MRDVRNLFDPRIDVVFKMIFSDTDEGKVALIDFLNCVLNLEGKNRIVNLKFVNSHEIIEDLKEKETIMDIRVQTGNGLEIDVEMQVQNKSDYAVRTLHYLSKMFACQNLKGKNYSKARKSIVISICDFVLFSNSDRLHRIFRFSDTESHVEYSDFMEMHYIELPKFKLSSNKIDSWSGIEKWSFFFKYVTDPSKHDIMEHITDRMEGIRMAYNSLIKISASERKRAIKDSREKFLFDWNSSMHNCRNEGIEEGIKKGMKEGIKEGIKKGERKTQIRIAKYLLTKGMSLDEIAAATGLELSEIEKI